MSFRKLSNFYKSLVQDVSGPVKTFLYRAFLIFFFWKLVYLFLLLPQRLIDGPLTNSVGKQTVLLLNFSHQRDQFSARPYLSRKFFEGQLVESTVSRIEFTGRKVMHIADGCNGLELFVLYIGFILLLPSSIWRKIKYLLLGILIIHVANLLRCAGLATIVIYIQSYFEFAHHYVFKMIIYGTIFLLWMKYASKLSLKIVQ